MSLSEEKIKAQVERLRTYAAHNPSALITEIADELSAVLAELKKAEPIGEMREGGVTWFGPNPHAFSIGTKFYAAPVVQQPALERYNNIMEGCSEKDPIERLRFFC